MVHDPGMGLPRTASKDDFTLEELRHLYLDQIKKDDEIDWRGERWRVLSVYPLKLEEVQEDGS